MRMGQVWSKADFDGLNETGHQGGHGSVLAVTAQNPGSDGIINTTDDLYTPLNSTPVDVSIDANPGDNCTDSMDRVRGFYSFHASASQFVMGDGSVRAISENISSLIYQGLSTIDGGEIISNAEF